MEMLEVAEDMAMTLEQLAEPLNAAMRMAGMQKSK